MDLMERWFGEFGDAQRTAAVARIEPLLGASQFHLLARRFATMHAEWFIRDNSEMDKLTHF